MKIAVYTCVTGGYDAVSAPASVDPRLDYHCWTDRPQAIPAPWQLHRSNFPGLDAKDSNRFVKMQPHNLPALADIDVSVYLDGSMDIVGDLYGLVASCLVRDESLFIYDHPFRDCVYDEAAACARYGHAPLWTLRRQVGRYRDAGLPAHAGLFECGVLVRRHTPAVARAMDEWWAEYRSHARRDQLSITWAAWQTGLRIGSLGPSDPRKTQRVFKLKPHARNGFSLRMTATRLINQFLHHSGMLRLPP